LEANIKLSWIIDEIAGKMDVKGAENDHMKKIFAIQSALFMIGYKVKP
jgi:hypothetical protein